MCAASQRGEAGPNEGRPNSVLPGAIPEALIRHIVIIGIAAFTTGVLVGGVGSRLVMFLSRIIAPSIAVGRLTDGGNRIGEFTLSGTLELVIFVGIFSGLLAAPLYYAAEPWFAWARSGRGLLLGCYLLALGGNLVLQPDSRDFGIVEREILNVAMFVLLYVLFGVTMTWLVSLLGRRLPPARGTVPMSAYAGLAVLGGILMTVVLLGIGSGGCEACASGAPFLAAMIGVMSVATIAWWYTRIDSDPPRRLEATAMLVGHVSFAIILIAGGVRLMQDIGGILT